MMDNVRDLECEDNAKAEVDNISPLRRVPWWKTPRLMWRCRWLAIRESNARATKRRVSKQHTEFEYSKRAGTSGVSGQLYETKLLCLILQRALNDKEIEHFLLGTNIRGIGDMDDICLRYRVRGQDRPVVLFVQAKHREDREKGRLTVEDVRSASGDFSLRKYFESYLTIKDRFRADNEDPMFEGNFGEVACNLVIYTPAKDCFTKKNTEHQVSEKMHHLINTGDITEVLQYDENEDDVENLIINIGDNTEVFQYDYNEDDIENLTKMTVMERLKKLGAVFLELIMSEKDKSEMILVDKLIARYHVVMAREVLQPCENQQAGKEYRMWEFRPQFFETDCEYLTTLKITFVKELSTNRWDQSKITEEDLKNWKVILQNPCAATISKLIGKIAIYNDKTTKLQLVQVTALKKIIKSAEFKALPEHFNDIETNDNVISKSIEIKLSSMKMKLPLAFGNLDMIFRGSDTKIKRRMNSVAEKLIRLFEANKHTIIVDINDDVVGPRKMIEQGIVDINGGIGSAVGNLLVLDPATNMLKFDLDNETLPVNAALFLKVLKEHLYKTGNKELGSYRITININGFPKDSFNGDDYDKRQARDFFNKLWFYTNQAKENEIESILKDDIIENHKRHGNLSKCKINSDAIFLRAHDDIQKWWMQSGKAPYLSRSNDFCKQRSLTCATGWPIGDIVLPITSARIP